MGDLFITAASSTLPVWYSDQLNEWMRGQMPITCCMSMGNPSQRRTWHHLQEIQFQLQFPLSGWAQSAHNDAHVLLGVDDWELLQDAEWGSPVALIIQEDLDEGHHAVVFQDNWGPDREYGARAMGALAP